MNKRDWINVFKGAAAMLVIIMCVYAVTHSDSSISYKPNGVAVVTSSIDEWRLQDETTGLKPINEEQIVYWVDDGEVYHLSKDCRALSRSDDIHSGTIAESGKERVCKICGN